MLWEVKYCVVREWRGNCSNFSIFYTLTCTVYRLKKSPADEVDVVVKLAVDAEDNAVVT